MRLLQEPILSLEQRIKQEIEENPALEEVDQEEPDQETIMEDSTLDSIDSDEDEFREEQEKVESAEDEFTFEDYVDEDDIPGYKLTTENRRPNEENREFPVVSGISYQDFLLSQIGMHKFSDIQYIIAVTIIGNLDDAGYLRREIPALADDLAFNQNIEVT